MTQLMRAISATCFAVLLAFGFAGAANAAEGGVSKASYSSSDSSLFQLVKLKPCCYNPYNRSYARSTPSTCNKYGGHIVQDGYCGGYGNYGYPGYPNNNNGYHPGWNGGHQVQQVCCKRRRRDWWSPNVYTCKQQGGYVVHASHCYNG